MKIPTKDLCFRIVIKLHDFLHDHESDEKGQLVSIRDDAARKQLAKLISGKSINMFFTSVGVEQIIELRRKAMKADHTYRPPNFLNYYYADCNDEIEAKKIVEMFSGGGDS